MTNPELFQLARANDPSCIKPLMEMLTFAGTEILRLEHERDALKFNPEVKVNFSVLLRTLFPAIRRRNVGKRGVRCA